MLDLSTRWLRLIWPLGYNEFYSYSLTIQFAIIKGCNGHCVKEFIGILNKFNASYYEYIETSTDIQPSILQATNPIQKIKNL